MIDKKDLLSQLEAGKSSIKDLINNLLDETKGFEYQITVKILLKNREALTLNLLQFISIQQQKRRQIINLTLKKLFKKFYTALTDELIKDLVGLLNQLILNTLTFQPLSGSSHVKLHFELRNSKTGLINIKNNGQKWFFLVLN